MRPTPSSAHTPPADESTISPSPNPASRKPAPPAEGSRAVPSSKPQPPAAGRLLLVATPIGHAQDITLRALAALSEADVIACEDTRVTARLLAVHGIERPLLAYHEHNAARMRPHIIERLARGQTV